MKKSVFAGLTALMLTMTLSAASAAEYVTLAELREQAVAEGWHQIYQVNGKELVADASIRLPSADKCPILHIEPLGRDESDSAFDAYRAQKNAQITADNMALTVEVINDESRLLVPRSDWGIDMVQQSDFYFSSGVPQHAAANVDLTYDKLIQKIDDALEGLLGVSLNEFQIDEVDVFQPVYQRDGKQLTKMGGYTVFATQLFHDIPLLDGAMHDRPNGRVIYGYSSPEFYDFTFACSKETAVLQEDIPLLPFDAIKARGQALIDAGKLQSADELTFGYVACRQDDGWATLPVWRIKGGCIEEGQTSDGEYDFNAQTGELLGTKEKAFDMPEALTWDDVSL